MLARMLATGIAFIFIAAATPAAWSAQGDTGGIKGKTTSQSGARSVAAPNAKIRTPQQCLRACRRLKGASPDFCVASCL